MEKITPGTDLLKAVSAKNLNEIGDAVAQVKGLDNKFKTGRFPSEHVAGVVRVSSNTNYTIPAFSPVSIIDVTETMSPDLSFSSGESVRPILQCTDYNSVLADNVWGVLLEPLLPGGISRAIISGIAICKVKPTSGEYLYVRPTAGKLETCTYITPARIIFIPTPEDSVNELDENGNIWAVVSFSTLGLVENMACPARIMSGSSADGYVVWLYLYGFENGRTAIDTLFVPEVACNESFDLPAGSVLMARVISKGLTGGND